MKDKHVIVAGLHTHYQEAGEGPVVLFLHGWGQNVTSFRALTRELVDEPYRFVALDLPGFGKTEAPGNDWEVGDYVTFVQAFLKRLDVSEPAALVCHSLGGRIAIKGVSGDALQPKRLVLIAAAGTAPRRPIRDAFFKIIAKIGNTILSVPPLSYRKDKLRAKLYQRAGSTDYLIAGKLQGTLKKVVAENLTEAAHGITTPTLLVWGEQDTTTPLSEAHTLKGAIRNSELAMIPKANHFVHESHPTEVAAAIKTFLDHA